MSDNENNEPQGGDTDDAPLVAIIADDGTNALFKAYQQRAAKEPTPAERVASALADFVSSVAPVAVAAAQHNTASEPNGESQQSEGPQGEAMKWEPMEDLGVKLTPWDTATADGIQARAEEHAAGIRENQAEESAIKAERFARSIPHGDWLAGQAQKHAEEQSGFAEQNSREHGAGHSI